MSEGGEDSDDVGFSMNLTYHLSPKTSIGLNGYRYILDTRNRRGVSLSGAPGEGTGDEGDSVPVNEKGEQTRFGSQYVATEITLSLRHQLTYKIAGRIGATFHLNRYKEAGVVGRKRKDDRIQGNIGLEYQMQRWIVFDLGYRYTDSQSNIKTEEYEENRFLAQFQLAF